MTIVDVGHVPVKLGSKIITTFWLHIHGTEEYIAWGYCCLHTCAYIVLLEL